MCPIPKIAKSAIYHSTLVQNTIFSPYLSFPWWCPRCSSWACACGGTAWPPSPCGPRGWPWSRGTSASPAPWTQAEALIDWYTFRPRKPPLPAQNILPRPHLPNTFSGGGGGDLNFCPSPALSLFWYWQTAVYPNSFYPVIGLPMRTAHYPVTFSTSPWFYLPVHHAYLNCLFKFRESPSSQWLAWICVNFVDFFRQLLRPFC